MIRLEEIKRTGEAISCRAYVENCATPFGIAVDQTGAVIGCIHLPENYEYCTAHVAQAVRYLKTLWTADTIPEKQTIMWY